MKAQEKKEAEKLTELLAHAEGHPMIKTILAEQAAESLIGRKADAEAIEVLKKEQETVIRKLQADLENKEAKYLKAKAALQVAFDEFQAAKLTLSNENNYFDMAIKNHEAVLIKSADVKIGEAILFFKDRLDFFRGPGKISSNKISGKRNLFTMTKKVTAESNVEAVKSALRYCQDAIAELERMKLCPEIDSQRIEQLKTGIPDINDYAIMESEKDVEKPPPTWDILTKHLDEKIDRLLGRT